MTGPAILLRAMSAVILATCLVAPAYAVDAGSGIDFDESKIGLPPEQFDFGITGQGRPGQWSVVRDVTAIGGIAVEQSSNDPTENRLVFAIYRPLALKNLAISMR